MTRERVRLRTDAQNQNHEVVTCEMPAAVAGCKRGGLCATAVGSSAQGHIEFPGGLAVKSRELSPAVRMARKLCKALSATFVMERGELQTAACREVLTDRRKGSPWSRAHPPTARDFDNGLAHALSEGWVSESHGSIHLTPAGADVAYRLRIGHRKI
ncbi:MAG TPA: hypothetical protein VKY24_03125 [Reyranella sp.]|nr:hypothetical protein [Reyranella sp.]